MSKTYDLAVMVSIRNTGTDNPIIIKSIQYFDSAGDLAKDAAESPLEPGPMATTEVVLSRLDKQGRTGANFIIVWGAEQPVHEPIVEALMTSTAQKQGLSFLNDSMGIAGNALMVG